MSRILVAILCTFVAGGAARAQETWPAKPLRWIVPYAPGGFADIRARKMGVDLAKALGQPVVIENRAGAGGTIGTDAVAKAPADGYTIGSGNLASMSVNVSLMKKLPYDPLKDLQPVMLIERSALILVAGPGLKANSVQELIAYAKANPGKVGFGSSGIGGAHHLSGEMLKLRTGVDMVHIPYKGGAPAAADLMAGHLPMMFEMGYAAVPSVKGGKTRALAVTSSQRIPLLPEVPTMAEAGLPGFESYNWQGVIAPAATPRAIVDRLNKELNAILAQPDQRDAILATASEPAGGTPEQFRDLIRTETVKWAEVVRAAKIQAE
ncbi:MAG TPA: tripartite tricarboxylate transporter substrate binding protein [Burkholderiales bacterium]